jgi:hypothetical protein
MCAGMCIGIVRKDVVNVRRDVHRDCAQGCGECAQGLCARMW